MALIRWFGENDPFSQLEKVQREMERVLSGARGGAPGQAFRAGVYPPMNVFDDGESYIVQAEIPGVAPSTVDITVSGDTLTLRGERQPPEVPEGTSYHRRERDFGQFRRAFSLPQMVDSSKVLASCKDGVLEIRLPRAEQAKQRKIEIKAS